MRLVTSALCCAALLVVFAIPNAHAAAACYETGPCNGLYDESASTIIRQLTQRFGQPPPSFPATVPGEGKTVTVCETYTPAVTANSSSYPQGMESYPLGCGRMRTYTISQYVKQGAPTSSISGVETTTVTTLQQMAVGAQITVNGGLGTVQESIQITNSTSWATTVTFNVLLWSQVYAPQRDVTNDPTSGDRCGTSKMGAHGCLEQ